MPRITSFIILLLSFHLGLKAQKAPDFTISDTEGKQWNLYDQIGQGKIVLLDFFFKDCKPCQTYTPMIEQLYKDYGSDTGKVLVLGISDRDDNNAVKQFEIDYGVSYPSCGYEGGGDTVTALFQNWFTFLGWPTYAVICSDTTVRWNVKKDNGLTEIRDSIDNCPETFLNVKTAHQRRNLRFSYIQNERTVKILNMSDLDSNSKIKIFDLTGQEIPVVCVISNGIAELHLDYLSPGLYLMRFRTSSFDYIQKILVN